MPTPIENTIQIILGPENHMRDKTHYLYDITGANLRWLHNCGSASKSVLTWLKKDYPNNDTKNPGHTRMKMDEIKKNDKDVFMLLNDPEYRWWTGVIEWSSCFDDYPWFKHEKIMEMWPHFDRFTLAPWEVIEQTPNVKHFIKIEPNLDEKMQAFAKEYDLKMYGNFPYTKPRWRHVQYVNKMAVALKPALKTLMRRQPKLREKLDEYLHKDYEYYDKAI